MEEQHNLVCESHFVVIAAYCVMDACRSRIVSGCCSLNYEWLEWYRAHDFVLCMHTSNCRMKIY